MARFLEIADHFMTNEYRFSTKNTVELYRKLSQTDREMFNFDVEAIDWDLYMESYTEGIKEHLLASA